MTDCAIEYLNDIKATYEAATEGPWEKASLDKRGHEKEGPRSAYVKRPGDGRQSREVDHNMNLHRITVCGPVAQCENDADFISQSRTSVPRMDQALRIAWDNLIEESSCCSCRPDEYESVPDDCTCGCRNAIETRERITKALLGEDK